MFHELTISDLRLGLDELFDRRLDALRATGVGRSHEPRLVWYRAQLLRIGQPTDSTRPLADRLAIASAAHNALGTVIHHLIEAYLRVPGRGEEQRQMLHRLRRVFMPRLAELRDSYATRAARAIVRREHLEAHWAELSTIPVREEETLAHWVRAFVEQGCTLGVLLARRADIAARAAMSSTERADPGPLRSALIGLVGRLRAAIADELAGEPSRQRQLDAQLFAYLDELAQSREAAHRAQASLVGPEPSVAVAVAVAEDEGMSAFAA